MNQELQNELKGKLEEIKKSLENELSAFATKGKDGNDWETRFPHEENCDDIECETDEVEEYENLLPVEHALELRLKDVNSALERISNNSYGVCENCHNEIEKERLEILPETRTCNNCKI
ncbi:MAG: TraR/DksA C4-type zinc finger protein [Candidatus Pacebacteria bacterium]|nr:TraR/DksA C4-type zinc finger protein [Candidatus Paceibacterota bacterium]